MASFWRNPLLGWGVDRAEASRPTLAHRSSQEPWDETRTSRTELPPVGQRAPRRQVAGPR
jgi:branched-chain amino acid transport system permease protein